MINENNYKIALEGDVKMGDSEISAFQDEKILELDLFLIDCCDNGGVSIRGECIKEKDNIDYICDMNEWEIYNNDNNMILKIGNSIRNIYIEIKNYIENIIDNENELIINTELGKITLESM